MDVLWRRQGDVSTILKTLPADSWTVTDNVFVRKSYAPWLHRESYPFPSRCRGTSRRIRFKKYTARVVVLGVPKLERAWYNALQSRPRAWISVEAIQLIGMESQRGGFWPGLRLLRCNIGWEIVPFISSFLSPTITNLELTLPQESNRLLQPTLSLLTHTCRKLQSLAMELYTSGPLSGCEMGRLISASRQTLRVVEIRPFTPPAIIPAIVNLPRLQDLTLQEPRLPDQIPPEVLPRFRAITFNGNHGPNLLKFFKGISVKRLGTVRITRGGIIQLSPLLELLRGASATMDTFHFSPVTALDQSTITLLCSFTNLTHLSIGCVCEDPQQNGPCSFLPTDANIQDLGEALPRIRLLCLPEGCRESHCVTFTSLVHLSRACGDLTVLTIRVDFTSIVGDQLDHNNPGLGVNHACPQRKMSGLTLLRVGNSPLPNAPRCEWVIALALVSVFPSIQTLLSSSTGGTVRRWDEVRGNILTCQKIFRVAQVTGKHLGTYIGDSDIDTFTSKATPIP